MCCVKNPVENGSCEPEELKRYDFSQNSPVCTRKNRPIPPLLRIKPYMTHRIATHRRNELPLSTDRARTTPNQQSTQETLRKAQGVQHSRAGLPPCKTSCAEGHSSRVVRTTQPPLTCRVSSSTQAPALRGAGQLACPQRHAYACRALNAPAALSRPRTLKRLYAPMPCRRIDTVGSTPPSPPSQPSPPVP